MMNKFVACLAQLLLLAISAASQVHIVDQRTPAIPKYHAKDVQFYDIQEFALDPQDVFLSQPIKILKYHEKVYILDRKLCKILVLSPQGKFLYSIGRPGQGPGDLEYPHYFTISQNSIYVLNSGARRIDVFSLDGNYDRRINISPPSDNPFSYPSHILVGKNKKIFVSYNLNRNIIDTYHENGQYEKTLFKREAPIDVPGVNIGNSSYFQLVDQGESIIHFNYFSGVFNKISLDGQIISQFSAYDVLQRKEQYRILNDIRASSAKQTNPPLRIEVYELWADGFCIEESGDIVTLLKVSTKEVPKKIYVFSKDGIFKYFQYVTSFTDSPISKIYFSDGQYFFITQQSKIFSAKRRSR